MSYRIGFGYDIHRLKKREQLWLGGMHIPAPKGTVGHSDGDALIHAIIDALLGAAGLPDIGVQFPDDDETFKNIDSKVLLKKTIILIAEQNFTINNIDTTICLQSPKVKDLIPDMKKILAEVMHIPPNSLSIKATTAENLGFVGKKKGVACYACAMLNNNNS
jgi:2-C-methyl-D-erythritol 2,4-cyclodiphosphate synthase